MNIVGKPVNLRYAGTQNFVEGYPGFWKIEILASPSPDLEQIR